MPGLYLVLCGESEEDLRAIVGRFFEVCRRRGLKVNADKTKEMLLGGEEWLECEVCVAWIRLEHVSKFKYLGCVLEESSTYEAECNRKGEGLQVLLGLYLMLRSSSLSVLESFMSHFLCLFLCMAVRQ